MKEKITPEVEIFTDGACSGNPGPGGWGAIIRFGEKEVMISGFMPNTTNNRMELLAAISALEEIATPSLIELTSDSKYLLDGIEKWINTWKLKGWKTSTRKDVKNVDLWKRLDELNQKHQITWKHIPGHKGHRENELCDELARNEIIKNR